MRKLKPVASIVADPTRCRAVVLSSAGRQCSRKPCGELRQAVDGQLYPVCRVHKEAEYFMPWTAKSLISQADAVRAWQRVLEDLRAEARGQRRRPAARLVEPDETDH